ncbi:MAG: hypothetical protein WA888_03455 [Burkholderiaceae bacterium]
MNLRRKLLLTASAGPLANLTFAQSTPNMHRVGVLHPGKSVNARPLVLAFEKSLVERGHIFGNVDNATHIEYRFVPLPRKYFVTRSMNSVREPMSWLFGARWLQAPRKAQA